MSLNTISETFPFSQFDPELVDFEDWEAGLSSLFVTEQSRITTLLHYLPNEIRYETIREAKKPLKYENLVFVLKSSYKKKLTLKEFYGMKQEQNEASDLYLKRMEANGRLLKLGTNDVLEQTVDGLKPSFKKFIVGNIYNDFKELKNVVASCERFEQGNPRYLKPKQDLPTCFACGSNHKHDWNICKKEREGKPVINFIKMFNQVPVDQHHVVEMNKQPIKAILDTGADASVVSQSMVDLLKLELKHSNCQIIGGGEPNNCLGTALVDLNIHGNSFPQHPFLVLNSHYPSHPIIGRDVLKDKMNCSLVWNLKKASPKIPSKITLNDFYQLIDKYSHDDTRPADVPLARIELVDGADISKLRQLPYKCNNVGVLNAKVDDLLNRNIMYHGISEICSPMFLVAKGNGDWRCVSDYRRVNMATKHVGYPVPLLLDQLQLFEGFEWFSKVDQKDSFFNIGVDKETGELISVCTPNGQYNMLRLGQGLKQSMGIFQYSSTEAFKDIKNKAVFVDDTVLMDKTLEEHYQNVNHFIEIATKKNVNINWEKSSLAQKSVIFCGFKVDSTGYTCKPGYLIQLKGIKSPEKRRECARILGMLSWVRGFVMNFENVIAPIRICNARKPFYWDDEAEKALKWAIDLLENTKLAYFKNEMPYDMYTDASGFAIGCTLYQDGKLIALFSKSLDKSEKQYSIHEKEMYAIEKGILKYGKYMGSNLIRIHCDSESAGWFVRGYGSKLTNKVKSWIDIVQPYNIQYVPIKGKANGQADLLSRLPMEINTYQTRRKARKLENDQLEAKLIDDDSELSRKQSVPMETAETLQPDVTACICKVNVERDVMVQCRLLWIDG
eukprot:NODE_402_length_8060_cov_0.986057.p1 type:complete len:840 gc:universal NODE_402_length_8060_cov_0.986057:3485-6004(+)